MNRLKFILLFIVIICIVLIIGICSKQIFLQNFGEKKSENIIYKDGELPMFSSYSQLVDGNKKLLASNNSEVQIKNAIALSKLQILSSTYREYTINDMDQILQVKQIRYATTKHGEKYYYSVHDNSKTGERLFVFYRGDKGTPSFVFFTKKKLEFNDFNNLAIGVSTIDDVRLLDPTTDFSIKYIERLFLHSYDHGDSIVKLSDKISTHMTKEGYVVIGYNKNNNRLIIDQIIKAKDSLVQSINSNDLLD